MSFPLLLSRRRHIEFEEADVSVLQNVIFPFLPVLASRLDGGLTAQLLELVVVHHLGADEAPLEVCVDGPCTLRGGWNFQQLHCWMKVVVLEARINKDKAFLKATSRYRYGTRRVQLPGTDEAPVDYPRTLWPGKPL